MNPKFQKILGWFLLFAGLFVIGWSLYSSFQIFTAKNSPPQLFKIKESAFVKKESSSLNHTLAERQVEQIVREQLKELIPRETINLLLNLVSWLFFAGLLIFGGTQLAILGIKLIK